MSKVSIEAENEILHARIAELEAENVLLRANQEGGRQWRTFDIALSNTPDFTYIFDLEGRFTYVNRALLSLWQKPLEAAVGKNFFELEYPHELAERLQRQIQFVIDTRETIRDLTPFSGPTGETRMYEYIFVPVLAANGSVEAVAGSTRDITEQNRTEQLLEADRRRWRELLLQTPAGIAILRGPEHRFEWANADYLRLLARPIEALVGKTVVEAIPEVEGQVYIKLLDGVYHTGKPFQGHETLLQLVGDDGSLKNLYVDFVYVPTRNDRGEIDGIFIHVTDVTDKVLARQRIEESEQQFRTLAETIPHLAWMADETGQIVWFNRRWYDYTGMTYDDMKGWSWQKVLDPAVLPAVLAKWQAALNKGEPVEMTFPLKGADGTYRVFLTRVEPVKDKEGRVVRWFGTNTDVTEQERTQEDLRKANRELEEFAYVASHDLQEPLRTVNIYTELLLKRYLSNDEDAKQFGGFIRRSVGRMQQLIQDLLSYSQTVHPDGPISETADLAQLLAQAIQTLKVGIEEAGATIASGPLPVVLGDSSQLAHVLQNVLSNSLKYRRQDVPLVIQVSAKPDHDCWIMAVKDNGIGFEQEYAERIFGLFKRLHGSEKYPGTGLGLAICKRIVERSGGHMWAEGRPGEGATIFFSMRGIAEGLPTGSNAG